MDRLSFRENMLTDHAGTIGYEVLDAIVQANIRIETLSVEDLASLLARFDQTASRAAFKPDTQPTGR